MFYSDITLPNPINEEENINTIDDLYTAVRRNMI